MKRRNKQTEKNWTDGIDKLPFEIWYYIFSFLDTNSRLSVQTTSHTMYHHIWNSQDTLIFSSNQITDNEFIGVLRKCNPSVLKWVQFSFYSYEGITNRGIDYLTRFYTSLTVLDMGRCRFPNFTDSGGRLLASLVKLKSLNLHLCDGITSVTLAAVSGLTDLECLFFDVDETVKFEVLKNLTKLEALSLWPRGSTNDHAVPLRDIPTTLPLTQLTLINFTFSEPSCEYIQLSKFTSLTCLHLHHCIGLNSLAKEMCFLSNLVQLKLKESYVTDYFISHLTGLTTLEFLHLGKFSGSFGHLISLKLHELTFDV